MDRICYTYVDDDAVGDADVCKELDLSLYPHITLVSPLKRLTFSFQKILLLLQGKQFISIMSKL